MIDDFTILYNQKYLLAVNRVIRNTYILLSMTIFFSAVTAYISMLLNVTHVNIILDLVVMVILLLLINYFKNTVLGIFLVFVFTGFMGYTVGPVLNNLFHSSHGVNVVLMSLLLTGVSFCSLSIYVIFSKKKFEFLGSFLYIGFLVILFFIIFNIFYSVPFLQLLISGVIVILSSGYILYDTSKIVNDKETNYVLATVSLYLNIYNMFMSLIYIIIGIDNN